MQLSSRKQILRYHTGMNERGYDTSIFAQWKNPNRKVQKTPNALVESAFNANKKTARGTDLEQKALIRALKIQLSRGKAEISAESRMKNWERVHILGNKLDWTRSRLDHLKPRPFSTKRHPAKMSYEKKSEYPPRRRRAKEITIFSRVA